MVQKDIPEKLFKAYIGDDFTIFYAAKYRKM